MADIMPRIGLAKKKNFHYVVHEEHKIIGQQSKTGQPPEAPGRTRKKIVDNLNHHPNHTNFAR
jgi:hypothetical protein